VNAFNRLFHRDEVYFSLFEPSLNVGWQGNVKKYKLCPSYDASCELGDVLDTNDNQAIGPDNKIKETAVSLWDTVEDGRQIREGGAGAHVPAWTSRVIYTDVSLADAHPATPVALGDSHKVATTNTDLRDATCADPTVGNTVCDDLIEWILGRDVNDEDDEPTTTNRWGFADPLHSSPVVVSYGGTVGAPVDKLFVGTNEGGVRMINGATGEEEWVFLPQVMLDDQETLMDNPVNPHIYGLDGVPAFRLHDVDRDGIIEPAAGDFVHMFIGMRRGGRNIYALDVTPSDVITDPNATGDITPKFLWRIVGGSNDTDGNYSRLGQTWSRPTVTPISVDDGSGGITSKTVLLFGGGYDVSLDSSYGTAVTDPNLGNAIFIVDADDGTLMRWISSDAGADITVPGMVHSIPSDLAAMDSDGDSVTDRVYVGDTGGNVWRVDLGATLSATDNGGTIVGKLASIATAGTAADERRIMYPPDVVQVHDSEYFGGSPARYDLVTVVTGNRADPLGTAVTNQVYAFRDLDVAGMTDVVAPTNLAEDYPQVGGAPLDQDDLTDLTGNALQDGDDTAKADALAALRASRGWYLSFADSGEKALAAPAILGGKLFFTTYLPEAVSGSCEAQEGGGRLYAVDVLSAKSVINFDGIGDDSNLSASDRTYTLGGGIPSSAVPIFQEEGITLLIGTSAGGESVDPELGLPRVRTIWAQEK
jgi:type IV pilus assembly protein PilY1